MTSEQKTKLYPLRVDLQTKLKYLNRARDLSAKPEVLVAIRRKIYEAQDNLISQSAKLGVCCPPEWFIGK